MNLNSDIKPINDDIKSYKNKQNSINLLKFISQSENDIENGDIVNQEDMFEKLGKDLFASQK